jgi:hypothetical protein
MRLQLGYLLTCLLAFGIPAQAQNNIFVEAPLYLSAPAPTAIVSADFNGDGKPDLAVANQCSATNCNGRVVSIFLGNGDGSFRPNVDYPVGNNATSIALGDFNGDGKVDLAVGGAGSANISILFGNGDGTFQPKVDYTVGASGPIVVGDFNGDSKPDIAVSGASGGIVLLINNGSGTFSVGPVIPVVMQVLSQPGTSTAMAS